MIANGDTTPLDNSSLRIYFLLELFKLLRLARIKKIMATSEVMRGLWERINIEIALSMKFIFMIALISHWIACIWGLIAYIEAGTFGDGLLNNLNWISNWVEESYVDGGLYPIGFSNAIPRYFLCLFWSIQSITSIGYGNIAPVTTVEYGFANALMLLCGVFWAYVIGNLVDVVQGMGSINQEYMSRMHAANVMMSDFTSKELPGQLRPFDVAGLVKGASRGEGLGNKFLATIRECDIIIHVVRSYIDDDVIHVDGKIDPIADSEVVNLELLLADLSHVQRRLEKTTCVGEERDVLVRVELALDNGIPARSVGLTPDEASTIKSMGLLTLKPVIYAFNVDEVDFALNKDEITKLAEAYMKQIQCDSDKDSYLIVSAKLEAEMSSLTEEERIEYMESIGIECSDSDAIGKILSYNSLPLKVKNVLDLKSVYTGPGVPSERSQTTKTHILASNSLSASTLAGRLHGDLKKGFMHAEVINSADLIQYDNYNAAKEDGSIRMEGKEYTLQDGDVVYIKWK